MVTWKVLQFVNLAGYSPHSGQSSPIVHPSVPHSGCGGSTAPNNSRSEFIPPPFIAPPPLSPP